MENKRMRTRKPLFHTPKELLRQMGGGAKRKRGERNEVKK